MVRCYRYALEPSVTQVAAIGRVCKAARGYWNGLVAAQRWAELEVQKLLDGVTRAVEASRQ
jgi:hypothetical protein